MAETPAPKKPWCDVHWAGNRTRDDDQGDISFRMSGSVYQAIMSSVETRTRVTKAMVNLALDKDCRTTSDKPVVNLYDKTCSEVVRVAISPATRKAMDLLSEEKKSEISALVNGAILAAAVAPAAPPKEKEELTLMDKARLVQEYTAEIKEAAVAGRRRATFDFVIAAAKASLMEIIAKGPIRTTMPSGLAACLALDVTKFTEYMDKGDWERMFHTVLKPWATETIGLEWLESNSDAMVTIRFPQQQQQQQKPKAPTPDDVDA